MIYQCPRCYLTTNRYDGTIPTCFDGEAMEEIRPTAPAVDPPDVTFGPAVDPPSIMDDCEGDNYDREARHRPRATIVIIPKPPCPARFWTPGDPEWGPRPTMKRPFGDEREEQPAADA